MSGKATRIQAPAKVNLYLKVLGKRPDGFHDLDTLFEALNFYDELSFSPGKSGIRLKCNISSLPAGRENLVFKAASLLKGCYGIPTGVHIRLKKNIPIAAGLGGGSSDAAATLLALNRFWNLRLSQKILLKHAAELGSDVPFFILKSAYAIGRGRGERLKKVSSHFKIWHVLVTPRLSVLAKDVYRSLNRRALTRSSTGAKMLATQLKKRDFNKLKSLLHNTLERVLLDKYPVIQRLKEDLLKAGSEASMVSGSGPTVFGIAKSGQAARKIASKLKKLHPSKTITVTSTLT